MRIVTVGGGGKGGRDIVDADMYDDVVASAYGLAPTKYVGDIAHRNITECVNGPVVWCLEPPFAVRVGINKNAIRFMNRMTGSP